MCMQHPCAHTMKCMCLYTCYYISHGTHLRNLCMQHPCAHTMKCMCLYTCYYISHGTHLRNLCMQHPCAHTMKCVSVHLLLYFSWYKSTQFVHAAPMRTHYEVCVCTLVNIFLMVHICTICACSTHAHTL